ECLILEHETGGGPPLVLERPSEDAGGISPMKATRAVQLDRKGRGLEPNRIQLRVRVFERSAGRAAVVVEDQYVLDRRVLCVMPVAVDVRLDHFLDLLPRQGRCGRTVIRAADQHLAGPERVPLPEAALALRLPV